MNLLKEGRDKLGHLDNAQVLVPGCGSGYECIELAKMDWVECVLGVDLSPTGLSRAKSLLKKESAEVQGKVAYEVGDFYTLDGSYDIIFDYTVRARGRVCVRENRWMNE